MNCPYCGNPISANQKFCTGCGAKLTQEFQQSSPVQQTYAPPVTNYTQTYNPQPVGVQNQRPAYQAAATPEIPHENFVAGIFGAIIGALLGGASIVLLGQLGVISALSGMLIALCTIKGYTILAKNISAKGIIVCIALILITPYIADRIDWAILVSKEMHRYDFFEAFAAIPTLIKRDVIDSGAYIGNLLKVYLFTGLGAFGMIRSALSK